MWKNLKYKVGFLFVLLILGLQGLILTAEAQTQSANLPDREQWFTNLGFGMFIHWSFDVQLGMVISHSCRDASDDYLNRYFKELPGTFDPQKFKPEEWVKIAKMAGMNYMVFTTKHHNGFCMYDTKTTHFKSTNTPFGVDATKEVIRAMRKEGIAVGIYFSPEDFWYLYNKNKRVGRSVPEAIPSNNPAMMAYIKKQMHELMTKYGTIDIVFIDGIDEEANTEIAKLCWKENPKVVVTRGAMKTPEQRIPGKAIQSPWEACFTLGNQWQYRPTNEKYKSCYQLIQKLVEVRAKGGNLLLNLGPDADGEILNEQSGVMNEYALWNFINQEALINVEAIKNFKEGDVWLMKKQNENTVYAFVFNQKVKRGAKISFSLSSIHATDKTKVEVLGQTSASVSDFGLRKGVEPVFQQTKDSLNIKVHRNQRIYNDYKWPNPIVVKLSNVVIEE
jgi:alpha-L-fucosidase